MIGKAEYLKRKKQFLADWKKSEATKAPVALKKPTTNLFRRRQQGRVKKLDTSYFDQVISIDPKKRLAEVGGMTTYETLVDETLKFNLMPAVVPQLKTITLGGAVSGIGIESSSFKYGFPHETVMEMEILTGTSRIINASTGNKHKDLFLAFPNSYGSLGYSLKLTIKLIPVKPYVKMTYLRFRSAKELFKNLKSVCDSSKWESHHIDFVDGMLLRRGEYYLCLGQMVDEAPFISDYTYKNVFYKSIYELKEDYLTIRDYIWRWDTDWFWCSKALGAQNPILRRIYGKKRLRSDFYMKLFQIENKTKITETIKSIFGQPQKEQVIQDVEIPIQNCEKFVNFYYKNINIRPTWICPVRQLDPKREWTLFKMRPKQLYVNFGFWGSVNAHKSDPSYYNRKLETEVERLQGKKSLYSQSFYEPKKFNTLYNRKAYDILKSKYDPLARFKDYYQKTVKRG